MLRHLDVEVLWNMLLNKMLLKEKQATPREFEVHKLKHEYKYLYFLNSGCNILININYKLQQLEI